MKVQGTDYRTVWVTGREIRFIDQNELPFRFTTGTAFTVGECCTAIREMRVRGAGALGALAGYAMALAFQHSSGMHTALQVARARSEIESTRPTAGTLFHATERVYEKGLSSASEAMEEARRLADEDARSCFAIGGTGMSLLQDGTRIMTHCNAGWLAFVDWGSALAPVYRAHQAGIKLFVYVDETRPRNQGARLTAWELQQEGVPFTIIPDNASAWLMASGKVDLVITGADRIARNGDTANKIGTLEKALAAREYAIPFYVAAPSSTFDPVVETGGGIPVEIRHEEEVLRLEGPDEEGILRKIEVAAPGATAYNPAFDITPGRLITGFITENGISHITA